MPEHDSQPLVRFDGVHKAFGDHVVLDDFCLDVQAGQHCCLIGPSGSGKSTVLRLLMTLEAPTGGAVLVDGEALWPDQERLWRADRKRQERIRRRIGMVFQHFNLFPHLRVDENIALAPRLAGDLDKKSARQRAHELLDQVGLGDKARAYPGELSGGQKQRVAIARALAMRPDIMLFDEATSALDPELVGEVLQVIEDLAQHTDMTMCFVTHQLHFVERIADRVVMLDGGRIVEDGDPKHVLSEPEHPRTQAFLAALHDS